ncbi:MAG: SusC/RagA family TonB-linked outer membrane protein [Tannerellaceae bacterium]|nr:SusC/RagA family TonB-linked outer membrane protein [Tannerellaceae bacterium]
MRRYLTLFVLFCIGTCTGVLWAQKKVSGVVMDKDVNMPLIGANVVVRGTTNGTVTDLDGNYTLEVNDDDILQFSYLGMSTVEETVGSRTVINVNMFADSQKINEVVVTAMGIERKAKSLTYATQQLGGNELTKAKDANMINSLQGKAAGLVITPNATGAGGSSKILLRGNKSAWGNNQPLIVIDGVPMNNPKTSQLEGEYEGRDGGDALSNLNPDDIASMNVLKGASAAALYGSMAANGVIMVTTKKGREGSARVDFSSNITMETLLSAPELQSTYGAIKTGNQLSEKSWGDKISGDAPGKNRMKDFFRTGSTYINAVTINGGTERAQSFLSYANTSSLGIMPTNDFQRHNMTARQSFKLFGDRLTVDASLSYITQKASNRPHGGTYMNPLTGIYTFPANGDFNNYKNNFEVFDGGRNLNAQNWYTSLNDFTSNPYWVLYRNRSTEKRDRIMASATANLKITDYLNIQGRLSIDNAKDKFERKWYATTTEMWAPGGNGRYKVETFDPKQFYGDVMLNFSKTFEEIWEVNASVGSSFMDTKTQRTNIDSDKLGLDQPNFFVPENIKGNGSARIESPRKRLNSVFGTAQFGFNNMIYVDITGRNDWSSALAFTNNISYFYPSAGLTALLNEMVPMGDLVNLLKVRGSYSIVGNDVPAYITHPMDGINLGSLEPNTKAPFTEMKPEKMHSMEFGFDLTMFDNRFNADFTYYKTNNKNQYFVISSPLASGYESYYINAGDIQNTGFEASANYRFDINNEWSWKTDFNISYNDNKVKKLDDRLADGVELGSGAGYRFMLKEGGSFGDVYGRALERDDNGVIVLNEDGNPKLSESNNVHLGNVNSKWQLGWGNTITYNDFSFYLLFDGKIGGNTIGMTQSYLDAYGVSQATGDARDNGGVDIGNGKKIDAQTFYESTAGKDKAGSEYVYSSTNFRLRELSLGYTFRNLIAPSKNLSVSLIARNLFFLYKDSPHDPEMSVSTHNAWQGFDTFGLPATRSYGINLKVTF